MLFNWKESGINIREVGMIDALAKMRNFVLSVYGKPIIECNGCDSSSYCKMCPGTATEVKHDEKIIGYATDNDYCRNIQAEYKKILYSSERKL